MSDEWLASSSQWEALSAAGVVAASKCKPLAAAGLGENMESDSRVADKGGSPRGI